jgi:SprT protein
MSQSAKTSQLELSFTTQEPGACTLSRPGDAQAAVIEPLDQNRQQQVIDHTRHYIRLAGQLFSIKTPDIDIRFDLGGRSAGMYRVSGSGHRLFAGKRREIRYNAHIFAKYFQDNYDTTVPHEVAHYVSDLIYGLKNIRPHGREWKAIMQAFGADDSVTADYDLAGIPQRRQTYHAYRCACRQHQLSTTRHNRIRRRRGRYYCQHCRQLLKIVE